MPTSWEAFLSFDDKYLRGKGAGIDAGAQDSLHLWSRSGSARKGSRGGIPRAGLLGSVARVDFLLDEVSAADCMWKSIPFPVPWRFICGKLLALKFGALVDKMVEYALRASQDKRQSVFSYDSSILQRGTGKA